MICPITKKECGSDKCKVQWMGPIPVYDCRLTHPKEDEKITDIRKYKQ